MSRQGTARVHQALGGSAAGAAFACSILALACASQPASEQPARSPSLDYPNPPAQTSDGHVVGADGQRPEDKLQAGPTNERPAPGWTTEHGTPEYNPANRVGGQTTHQTKGDTDPPKQDEDEDKTGSE